MSFSANAAAICDLDAEISRLDDKRRSLQTLRNSKLPFFHLPLEICVFIFSLACHHGRLPEKWEKKPPVTTPFVISSICHAWRAMARSAPELWCFVSLCVRPYIEDHSEIQAELLDQWLRLAQALPLSIVMTFEPADVMENDEALANGEGGGFDSEGEESLAALAAVTSVATSRSHQWESLSLFLPFYWAKIFESGMGHCPNLKSIDLDIDTEGVDSFSKSSPPFSTTFRDAPKLRTVTIGKENINVRLPWHQLEKMTFWGHAPLEAFLSKCTNLKNFRGHHCWLTPYKGSRMSVHLSKLVSLEITSVKPQNLLGILVTPALVSITIPLQGRGEVEAFSAFLKRSGVTLKHLSIIEYVPGEELLWKIFDALPNLSHLEIDEPDLDSQYRDPWRRNRTVWHPSRRFFNYFSTPNTTSGGLPLPHLASFKYRGQLKFQTSMKTGNVGSGNSVDVDTLEKVFLARWNAGLPSDGGAVRLREFSLFITTDSPRLVTQMEQSLVVKELRNEGMGLVFKLVDQGERR